MINDEENGLDSAYISGEQIYFSSKNVRPVACAVTPGINAERQRD